MGSKRDKRTTLFPLLSAGHRRHPFLSWPYPQNYHITNDTRGPSNCERSRLNSHS
jgi:hypothetical protein